VTSFVYIQPGHCVSEAKHTHFAEDMQCLIDYYDIEMLVI